LRNYQVLSWSLNLQSSVIKHMSVFLHFFAVVWDILLCNLVEEYQRFGRISASIIRIGFERGEHALLQLLRVRSFMICTLSKY
jgi:hypothetical protein